MESLLTNENKDARCSACGCKHFILTSWSSDRKTFYVFCKDCGALVEVVMVV